MWAADALFLCGSWASCLYKYLPCRDILYTAISICRENTDYQLLASISLVRGRQTAYGVVITAVFWDNTFHICHGLWLYSLYGQAVAIAIIMDYAAWDASFSLAFASNKTQNRHWLRHTIMKVSVPRYSRWMQHKAKNSKIKYIETCVRWRYANHQRIVSVRRRSEPCSWGDSNFYLAVQVSFLIAFQPAGSTQNTNLLQYRKILYTKTNLFRAFSYNRQHIYSAKGPSSHSQSALNFGFWRLGYCCSAISYEISVSSAVHLFYGQL